MMKGCVLVVDDDRDILELIEDVLVERGYEVLTATDGMEAYSMARATRPAVILMDMMMPLMNGLEASRSLRADPDTAAIPIVALSAHVGLEEAARLHLDDHLPKPFNVRDLLAVVARWTGDAGT